MERGIRLKQLRKDNKDTLKELAAKIDYDYSNLSKIERGIYKGTLDVFEKIAKVYGVDVSYFTHDTEGFTSNEQDLLFERTLTPQELKDKYVFNIDGKPASDEEIEKMIEYIKEYRMKQEAPNE